MTLLNNAGVHICTEKVRVTIFMGGGREGRPRQAGDNGK